MRSGKPNIMYEIYPLSESIDKPVYTFMESRRHIIREWKPQAQADFNFQLQELGKAIDWWIELMAMSELAISEQQYKDRKTFFDLMYGWVPPSKRGIVTKEITKEQFDKIGDRDGRHRVYAVDRYPDGGIKRVARKENTVGIEVVGGKGNKEMIYRAGTNPNSYFGNYPGPYMAGGLDKLEFSLLPSHLIKDTLKQFPMHEQKQKAHKGWVKVSASLPEKHKIVWVRRYWWSLKGYRAHFLPNVGKWYFHDLSKLETEVWTPKYWKEI